MQKIMSHLNLPRLVTSTSSNNILKKIPVNSVDIAEQSMIKASSILISMYTDNYDDADIENCKKDVGKVVPVGVTVDETWQERSGFNSLLGVVFIISVHTGEVLDYEIKCKHCFGTAVNGARAAKNTKLGITSMRVNVQ